MKKIILTSLAAASLALSALASAQPGMGPMAPPAMGPPAMGPGPIRDGGRNVPELDAIGAPIALALVGGIAAVAIERRRRKSSK